ncbi:carboxy-S-adenosyl-L-methionine synthase CmoA [Aliidiomarina iranensis]|uniref:Carboxy-S-adenosyl-L-methionine synthase n=1 Tax=Aliidiomarina iranensis TaxID=1434071 RepID=A0A432VTE0_9GAMM|nr:carboxy-S-adenosyl-L-methionine synthase CmoA [Aliidiomarina iranensis]RUO19692.1 carboxy-S-adenosyl-L-methionine synthase CmoA [Aliidiomarina iranensis]
MKANQPSQRDSVYAQPLKKVSDFAFDTKVADVFPDMISRSIPGYATIIDTIGRLATRYVRPNSRVYDLGCSLGAASLAIKQHCQAEGVEIIAIDNSEAMVERCQNYVNAYRGEISVHVECTDIATLEMQPCSMVVLNFTLQFVPPEQRDSIIQKIFEQLQPGGLLVISEKVKHHDNVADELLIDLYHEFKRNNGYSDLEISQKRAALENVMRLNTPEEHIQRLTNAGFSTVQEWFRCFNFTSWLALKAPEATQHGEK